MAELKQFSNETMKQFNNNHNPLVSVIMPVYNAGEFLVEAIKSILKQTYQNYELIIVNDASEDNSLAIINRFKKHYPDKIKVINLKRTLNKGGDACANIGFKIARGKFIARMDADDIAHPERLEKQVQFLQSHDDIFIVGSCAYVIDKKGEIIGEKNVPYTHDEIYRNFFITHPMIHPSIMLRKNSLPSSDSLYMIKYNANNDYLTFFKFLTLGKFANLEDKLIYYRIHGKNDSLINVKARFINSLKIRWEAMIKFDYQPSFESVLALIPQILLVFLLPERLVLTIYMLWRGMYKPKIFSSLNILPALARFKNYALSFL